MKSDAIREYLRLCDLHNVAFIQGRHADADKYWQQRMGFFDALEALGTICVGDIIMTADRYVTAKFNVEPSLSAGFLLGCPVLTGSQYEKLVDWREEIENEIGERVMRP